MVVDTSNLLFRVAAARGKYNNTGTPEEQAGLAMHISLQSLNKFYKQFKPDQVAVTFEGHMNWRKAWTASDKCKSKKIYKANRIKDSSMEPFFELMKSFEDLVRKHSSLVCLSHPMLEGDDVFAGYVTKYCEEGDEVIGVSGDKDFVQLLKHKNFTLINPDKGKPRTLIDVCGVDDADYFMFEKAFRGDKGDNVFPAYPRVQAKRLQKAMSDEYELTKIMNETWDFIDPETQEKTTYLVRELFEENNILMNLEYQPDHIKAIIKETIESAQHETGKFSFFEFTKFCGKFDLKQIAENGQQFADLFNASPERAAQKALKKSILSF